MNTNLAISSIMTKDLITVKPDDRLDKIQMIFRENMIHHIPVVDNRYQLVGMISKIDMLDFLHDLSKQTTGPTWSGLQFKSLTASRVMTPDPISLNPDDSMSLAADIFLGNQLHSLPVVEGGELLGLVTSHDLLKFAFKETIEPKLDKTITQ